MSLLSALGLMRAPETAGDYALQTAIDPINLALAAAPLTSRFRNWRSRGRYGPQIRELADAAKIRRLDLEDAGPSAEAMLSELAGLRERNPGLSDVPDLNALRTKTHPRYKGGYNKLQGRMDWSPEDAAESLGPTMGGKWVDPSPLGTVRHEFGHHVYNYLPASEQIAWEKALDALENPLASISSYPGRRPANSLADELFAEAFAASAHPRYGQGQKLPGEVEAFMQSLLTGQRSVPWRMQQPNLSSLYALMGLGGYNTVSAASYANSPERK